MSPFPQPTVTGSFQKTPFPHILVYLLQRAISGTLVVRHSNAAEMIWFEKGSPAAASFSSNPASMEEGLLALFGKPYTYEFFGDAYLIQGAAQFAGALSPLALIHKALPRSGREDVIGAVLERLRGKVVTLRRDTALSDFGFDPSEKGFVTALVGAPCTAEEAIARTELSQEHARRVLYLLAITKTLEALPDEQGKVSISSATLPKVTFPPNAQKISVPTTHVPSSQPTFRDKSLRPAPRAVLPTLQMPSGLSPEMKQRWMDTMALYEKLEELNYCEVLGISVTSSGEEAATAYMKLVKRWHPDRLPAALSALAEQTREIFRYLTEAHEVLTSADKRADYVAMLEAGAGSPAEQRRMLALLDSATEVQRANFLLQQKSYEEALQHAQTAVDLTPDDPDAQVALAWALYNLYGHSESPPFDDMMKALNLALEKNDGHERAHYCKGMVLKRRGKTREALGHFKLAVQINPRNVDAAREIRLAAMREKTPSGGKSPSGASLFGKLFKK
ncbi:MAG: DnaJ domain-containing protein [Myxococcales bacterium]|nr:DnaJ domain-containing protein [Myxococcales bacterium]